MSNELVSTPVGAPSRRWVAAMAGTALVAVTALALSIAAILSAGGTPAVIGPTVATPAPLVHVSRSEQQKIARWYRCAVKATTPEASLKCLPGSGK